MTAGFRPLEHPVERRRLSARTSRARLEILLAPLGTVLLLAGPTALLWAGLALVGLAWLRGANARVGWLATPGPFDIGWLALLVGSLLGFLVSPNPGAALGRLAAVVAAITLFFWLREQAHSPAALRRAGWGVVLACGSGALVVLALIRGQLPDSVLSRRLAPLLTLFAPFPGVTGDVLEVNSRFPVHQYGLAYLLLVMIPFFVAAAVFGRDGRMRALAGGAALALATLLAATETRGALLALAVAVALMAGLRSRWFWLLLPGGAAALYLLLARGIISRSLEAEWLNARLSIWSRSLSMLGDYPLTGAGLGMHTFAEVFAWTFGLPNPYLVVHSHNIFIQAYAEQGLFGLVGLLVVLGASLLAAWRGARNAAAASRAVSAGVLGALVGTALYGLTDQVPTTNDALAIAAALCALAAAGNAGGRERGSLAREPGRARARETAASPALRAVRSPVFILAAALAFLAIGVAPRWVSGLALNVGAAQLAGVALNRGADLEQRSKGLGRAESALRLATEWNPRNSAAFRDLARVRVLRNDVPGAAEALGQAQATQNLNTFERTQLGRIYYEIGFWQQAFDLWQAGGQIDLLRQAAEELSARREYRGAAAAYAALVEVQPEVSEHVANLAKAVLAGPTPSVDEAMRWFDRAAELNPDIRRSLSRQLVLQAEDYRTNERRCAGRVEQAVFWFSLASRVDATFDKPEVELGAVKYYAARCAEQAGRTDDAAALFDGSASHFRAATQRDPKSSSSWNQLGQAEEASGRLLAAAAAHEQAVRLAPNRGGLHASLGHVYARLGQCEAAARELNDALRLEPGNATAQAELARLSDCR